MRWHHHLGLAEERVLCEYFDDVRMLGGSRGGGIELFYALQIRHGKAHEYVVLVLHELAPRGVDGDGAVRLDLVACGDDRAPLVVLREIAELVRKFGSIDIILPEHLHQVRLGYVREPLNVLTRIQPAFCSARDSYWLMLPPVAPTFLPFSLPRSAIVRSPWS